MNIIDMHTTSQKQTLQDRRLDRARTARRDLERRGAQGRVWVRGRPVGQPAERFAHLYETYAG